MTLAGGICAALLKRERTGETSVVDGSLMGTAVWFNGPVLISTGLGRDQTFDQRSSPREARPATQNTYRTKDGRFLILSMLGDHQDEWEDMVDHLGRPDLKSDPRFLTAADRQRHSGEAVAIFDEVFAKKTSPSGRRSWSRPRVSGPRFSTPRRSSTIPRRWLMASCDRSSTPPGRSACRSRRSCSTKKAGTRPPLPTSVSTTTRCSASWASGPTRSPHCGRKVSSCEKGIWPDGAEQLAAARGPTLTFADCGGSAGGRTDGPFGV